VAEQAGSRFPQSLWCFYHLIRPPTLTSSKAAGNCGFRRLGKWQVNVPNLRLDVRPLRLDAAGMGDWLIDLGNWLSSMLPTDLLGPQATVRGAQITSLAALAAACIALVAAIITALVALRNGYLTVRTTVQVKHADFRQAWINSLRDEMTAFESLALASATNVSERERKLAASATKIILLMNPKDTDYQELLNSLHAVFRGWDVSQANFLVKHAEMNGLFQRILKREWNVTKKEMHETARFLPTRLVIGLWRLTIWIPIQLYRWILRPLGRQICQGDINPLWDKHGNATKAWIKAKTPKPIMVRYCYWSGEWQDRQKKRNALAVPGDLDLSELPGRGQGLDSLFSTTSDGVPPTSNPAPVTR